MRLADAFRKKDDTPPVEPHHEHHAEELEKSDLTAKDGQYGQHGSIQREEIDPAIEKRVVRKMDRTVVPLVMALYLLAFLDRSNIGNARIAGMEEDLDLTGDKYDWLLTIFYISYITFQWQSLMWKLIPPHIWCAFCVFGWGLVSTVQAGIHTWGAEMALRFLMGVFEAGYGPGMMSFWNSKSSSNTSRHTLFTFILLPPPRSRSATRYLPRCSAARKYIRRSPCIWHHVWQRQSRKLADSLPCRGAAHTGDGACRLVLFA